MLQRVLIREWLRALPDVARLLWNLVRDDRVPPPAKVALGGCLAYVVLPYGLIPNRIPLVGRLDDTLVAALGIRTVLRRIDEGVLVENWPRNPEVLGRLIGKDLGRRPVQRLIRRDEWGEGRR